MKRSPYILLLIAGVIVGTVCASELHAQQPIGGPYEPDSATVLLMHFDGNFQNASDYYEIGDPRIYGNISFLQMHGAGDLGYQAHFGNDSPDDKSHIQIPDTTALDLEGSWTIEMWVNVYSFGTTQDDWRRQPRLYVKPGDPEDSQYYYSNYFFNIFGTRRDVASGYFSSKAGTWVDIRSPNDIFRIGEWYHLTFIRDTSKQVIVQMIHQNTDNKSRLPNAKNDSLELTYFESFAYGAEGELGDPNISDQPLFIATSPQNDTAFANLDGFMDEIRISNTVRNFTAPPIIKGVTELGNQQPGQSYDINATIETLDGASVASATLNYRVNDGSWNQMTMSEGANNEYSATIPSQDIGTSANYYISAKTSGGLTATSPARAESDSTYYQFAVMYDSTAVFHLDFDQSEDVPSDQSKFESDVILHGTQEAAVYGEGEGGTDDQAMRFTASDSVWLETNAIIHQLESFSVEFNFYAHDSVPTADTRLLAKGPIHALPMSNYQVNFDSGGVLRPAIFAGDNSMSPCGSYTGGCLVLDDPDDGHVQAETWYRVQIGIQAPDSMTNPITHGLIFSKLINLEADSVEGEKLYQVDAAATPNSSSLKIGGTGGVTPYFNGLMDDIVIRNYIPQRFLPGTCIKPALHCQNIENQNALPSKVELKQNYPNPFNPTTQIKFSLPQASEAELTVYDMLGRRVATLVDGKRRAGQHSVTFDAGNLSSGVYIYRLKAGEYRESKKMLLVK